ncbi:hypothetical protein IFM53868_10687 [Aspergillus udagawae]|uniref:Uncharacterized protein n=1 Tax=Aspergillus udagawae TaxID=91492 RepID=A0ABQ1BES7_9EURO|nr:hypothetical protein IFM53868_10687 [Aspergillus udagawae]
MYISLPSICAWIEGLASPRSSRHVQSAKETFKWGKGRRTPRPPDPAPARGSKTMTTRLSARAESTLNDSPAPVTGRSRSKAGLKANRPAQYSTWTQWQSGCTPAPTWDTAHARDRWKTACRAGGHHQGTIALVDEHWTGITRHLGDQRSVYAAPPRWKLPEVVIAETREQAIETHVILNGPPEYA